MMIKESPYILDRVENLSTHYKKQVKYNRGFVILHLKGDKIKRVIPLTNGSVLDEAKAIAKRNNLTVSEAQRRLSKIDGRS